MGEGRGGCSFCGKPMRWWHHPVAGDTNLGVWHYRCALNDPTHRWHAADQRQRAAFSIRPNQDKPNGE